MSAFDPTFFDPAFFDAAPATSASAGVATGSGSGLGASTALAGSASASAGTGASGVPSASVAAAASSASSSGQAFDATVSTASTAIASAGAASGSGSAFDAAPTSAVSATSGASAGSGSSLDAAASVGASATSSSGSGSAFAPTRSSTASAGSGSATGSASTASVREDVSTGSGSGTGSAFTPTIPSSVLASAGAATGTGAVNQSRASVAPTARAGAGSSGAGSVVTPTISGLSSTGSGNPTIGAFIGSPAAGALILMFIVCDALGNTSQTFTAPSGWTLIATAMPSNGDGALYVFSKISNGSEPSVPLFTGSPNTVGEATASAVVVTGTIGDIVVSTIADNGSGTSHTSADIGVDGSTPGLLLVASAGTTANSWTPPSGMSEFSDSHSASWASLEVAQSATLTAGTRTSTSSSNGPTIMATVAVLRGSVSADPHVTVGSIARPTVASGTASAYDAAGSFSPYITTTPGTATGSGSGSNATGYPVGFGSNGGVSSGTYGTDGAGGGSGRYLGGSMAIHSDTWDSAPPPTGPVDKLNAHYQGAALKVTSHADSPAQWVDSTITGPDFTDAVYRGRSPAIHVYGAPAVTPTPPTPVPACKCCEEAARVPAPDGSGWVNVFHDDFSTWDASRYSVYPTSYHDSSGNGTYDPSIISSDGSKLRIFIHTVAGSHRVAAFIPQLPGGSNQSSMRVTFRARADPMHGYKAAPLLWPQSGVWPRDGESDFPEGNFDGNLSAFMHRQDATVGSDQAYFATPAGTHWNDWHVYTQMWIAGQIAAYYVDGVQIGSTTDRVPATPMHLVMQFETNLDGFDPDDSVQGFVEIDYLDVEILGSDGTTTGVLPGGTTTCVESEDFGDGRDLSGDWGTAPNGNTWSLHPFGVETLDGFQIADGVATITTHGKQTTSGVSLNGGFADLPLDNPVSPGEIYIRFQTKFTPNDVDDSEIGYDPGQVAGITYDLLSVTIGNPSGDFIGASVKMIHDVGDLPGDPPHKRTFVGVTDSTGLDGGNSVANTFALTLLKNTWYELHIHYETANTWAEITDVTGSTTAVIATPLTSLPASVRLRASGPYGFVNNDLSSHAMPDTTTAGPGYYWINFDYVHIGCATSSGASSPSSGNCSDCTSAGGASVVGSGTSSRSFVTGSMWTYDEFFSPTPWTQTVSPNTLFYDGYGTDGTRRRTFHAWGLYNDARRRAKTVHISNLDQLHGLILHPFGHPDYDKFTFASIPYTIYAVDGQWDDTTHPSTIVPAGSPVYSGVTPSGTYTDGTVVNDVDPGTVLPEISFDVDVSGWADNSVLRLYCVADLPDHGGAPGAESDGSRVSFSYGLTPIMTYDWDEYDGDPTAAPADCVSDESATLLANSFDTFERTLTTPVPSKYIQRWQSNAIDSTRVKYMARRDRSIEILNQIYASVNLPWDTGWLTNGFGIEPIRPDISTSPRFYNASGFFNDPNAHIGWLDDPSIPITHFDWETRTATPLQGVGLSFPANLTNVGFFQADQNQLLSDTRITVHRPTSLIGIKDTILNIHGGRITSDVSFDDTLDSTLSVTIPSGANEVYGDISWVPPSGSPDFIVALGGDPEVGAGEETVHTQDTVSDFTLTIPPTTAMPRYPNEIYSLNLEWFDILGHHHDGWGANDSGESATIQVGASNPISGIAPSAVPRYTMAYDYAPGWGVGPLANWQNAATQGDDWSDFAQVDGGRGILRAHANPITGLKGYAEVSSDDPIYAPFDYSFTTRFGFTSPSYPDYRDGVWASLLVGIGVYPGDNTIDFADTLLTPALAWTETVMWRVKGDHTGSYLKVWQAGDAEPADWQISNTTSFWRWTDGVDFFRPDFALEVPTSTMEQVLYVGPGRDYTQAVRSQTGSCAECMTTVDGVPVTIPPFTPGYLPTFRPQIGDPTTSLDASICTLESGAMVLDWHTRGAVKVWGGELVPYCGRTEAEIAAHGTTLGNVRQAWLHWGQDLSIRSGGSWSDLMACLAEGRAVILQGDYGYFSLAERCQDNFVDNHAISVFPYQSADRLLVGDPLCKDFKGFKISSLQAYAEGLGRAVYGTTSPQKILFAVSRPWTP